MTQMEMENLKFKSCTSPTIYCMNCMVICMIVIENNPKLLIFIRPSLAILLARDPSNYICPTF